MSVPYAERDARCLARLDLDNEEDTIEENLEVEDQEPAGRETFLSGLLKLSQRRREIGREE